MTDLLSPPSKRTPSSRRSEAGSAVARPLWLGAGFAGLVGSLAMLTACMALGLVGWFASDAGAHGDTRDAIRVGAVAWLMGHRSGLTIGATGITVMPLGLTALCGYVCFRLGRWARLTSADDEPVAVGLAALVLAGCYAVVALVAAVLATVPAAEPGLMPAFTGAFLLALTAGGGGMLRTGPGSLLARRLPATWAAVLRGGAGAAAGVLAAGAVLVATALARDLGTAATVLSRLHVDGPDSALYTLVVAALAPNAALMGSSYLLGPGFAVGTATVVAPSGVELGPVPAFPLLAALPPPGPGPGWATALVAVPVMVAVAVGFLTVRRHPTTAYETGAVRGLGSGVLGGALLSVLVWLAGGAVGPGRMADVGAAFVDTLAAAVVALGVGGLVGAVLATWLHRRHGLVEDEPGADAGTDPEVEDTVRLYDGRPQ